MATPTIDPFAAEQRQVEKFLSGSVIAAKFPKPGHVVEGTILSFEMRQQTGYDSGEPLYWEGKERVDESKLKNPATARKAEELLLTVQGEPTGITWKGITYEEVQLPDDDGQRTFYISGGLQNAMARALKDAGVRVPEINGYIRVERIANGVNKNPRYAPPHRFSVTYTPAAQNGKAAADFLSQEAVEAGNPFGDE